jgi:plasmid maintenance system antidote protein VapI
MSDAARPDGSDPRVLTVPDDAPDVLIARNNSSAKAYHTNRCATVKQMTDPKRVARPVAEWNDHEKCARCRRIDSDEDYERPGSGVVRVKTGYHSVSPVRCLALRAFALSGLSHTDAAERINVTKSTATRHINGNCTCDHYGHTVAYDANGRNPRPAGDGGVPTNSRDGNVFVPNTTCARIRRLLADTDLSANAIAAVLGASDRTIRKHATNTDACNHDHGDTHTPVEYDHAAQTWRHVHE